MCKGQAIEGLLQPLIEGIVEDPAWSTFLDALRARVGGEYASLVFRPFAQGAERNRVIHLYSGRPSPPLVSRLYHDSLHAIDPMPYQDMAEGVVYPLDDLLDLSDPAHRAYFEDFLVPSGMTVIRMLRVTEPGGVSAWLTIARAEGEFASEVDALLGDLAACLRSALRSYVALERARLSERLASEAIRRMNFGWIALDAGGRILETDSHAARMLEGSGVLARDRRGRLTGRDPPLAEDIAQALRDLGGNAQARPRAIVLSREPWLDLLLVASPAGVTATGPAPAIVAYAILYQVQL